ncbi:hypothetical protein BKA69DRAFT_1094172 [Paraphysoderma sedebokerense]|nr:hypothetical protein BKA69DRAFT_1094172 [Paraphysoderma sedebokerense]
MIPPTTTTNPASNPPDFDTNSEQDGPVSSFQSYAAEGDLLAKQGEYRKAIEAYTKALNIRIAEKNCLVARSKCYLQLGDADYALADADLALKEDPDFFKGMFQKAEALYATGDFEMALVFYHRGNKLRPELDEFRLGIQKAREAIDNSIGNPQNYKFKPPANFSLDASKKPPMPSPPRPAIATGSHKATSAHVTTDIKRVKVAERPMTAGQREPAVPSASSERTAKQLLGELYADKEYLEQLMNDRDFINNPNEGIRELVQEALRYLDTRTEFWRQQKPIYARKTEAAQIKVKISEAKTRQLAKEKEKQDIRSAEKMRAHRRNVSGAGKTVNAEGSQQNNRNLKYMLESIKQGVVKGKYDAVIRLGSKLASMSTEKLNEKEIDSLSQIHCALGIAYMMTEQYEKAEETLVTGLALINKLELKPPHYGQIMGNLGRVYARQRKFKEAIQIWETQLSNTATTSIEKAWLYHDLAKSYIALDEDNSEKIRQLAEQSIQCARESGDAKWSLNSSLLLAQLCDTSDITRRGAYADALSFAKELKDIAAISTIQAALEKSDAVDSLRQVTTLPENVTAVS